MEPRKVELHPAHVWTCEDCGRDNFVRSIDYEFEDDADREEMFRRFNHMDQFEQLPEEWKSFGLVTAPDDVKCQHCGSEFAVEHPEPPLDEEDDEE